MAANRIEGKNGKLYVMMDELIYSIHTDLELAEKDLKRINDAKVLEDAIDDAVDKVLDELSQRFPTLTRADLIANIKTRM